MILTKKIYLFIYLFINLYIIATQTIKSWKNKIKYISTLN